MRLTSVDMYSPNFSEVITFSLRDPGQPSAYMIRSIAGLDAEELVPKFYGFGAATSPRFYEFGMKPRDVVMRIVLNPNFRLGESYSDIRDDLYRAISATRTGQVVLHFKSGTTVVARIMGFITKFEVGYFNQLPEVQITVHCDDPMFRGINPVIMTPAKLPTANPVLVPDSLSTSPHGFQFQVTFKASTPSFTIQEKQTNPEWNFVVTPASAFASGDALYFSSDFSNKYLYMIRAGVTTYLIDKLSPNSVWPVLFPGQNSLYFANIANFNWNTLQFYAAYWGV